MNRKKCYIIAMLLSILAIGSSLGQVFAVQGTFTGNDVYLSLKNKYEWEYIDNFILEDYLTKGLIFENLSGENGCDMSLVIPHTDSFGGVIEAFIAMLESEDEAIRLFLDLIENKENFDGIYGGRKIEIEYGPQDTKVVMYSIKEKNIDNKNT